MTNNTVTAPWSDEQLKGLIAWQADPTKHAYTCETSEHGPLTVSRDDLRCPIGGCGYRQTWAMDHTTEREPLPEVAVDPMAAAFAEMADSLAPFREFCVGERARFIGHGFTEAQAGDLAVEMFRQVLFLSRQNMLSGGGQQQ